MTHIKSATNEELERMMNSPRDLSFYDLEMIAKDILLYVLRREKGTPIDLNRLMMDHLNFFDVIYSAGKGITDVEEVFCQAGFRLEPVMYEMLDTLYHNTLPYNLHKRYSTDN